MAASVNTNRGPVAEKKRYGVGDALQVVRCNHCKTPVLFEHRALHAFECRQARMRAKQGAMNLEKEGKSLYAVVISRKRRKTWMPPETLYAHADNPSQAKVIALTGETGTIKIVETGLAVGWFQDQQTGIITG